MKSTNWTVVAIVGILALLILMFGASLIGSRGYNTYGYGGWGMMGPWMMGGMFFMWLVPLGILVLTVMGIAWLVRTGASSTNPGAPAHPWPSCGRSVQADWKNCPYCGTVLAK